MYFLTRRMSRNVSVQVWTGNNIQKTHQGRLSVTCQGSNGAQPVANTEPGPAEDGVDEGPTENGSSSSNLWVSMIDVVQDVRDILFLCEHKWPNLYLLHQQIYTTNKASFSEQEEKRAFYICKRLDYNILSSKRCLGFKGSRFITLQLSQHIRISRLWFQFVR